MRSTLVASLVVSIGAAGSVRAGVLYTTDLEADGLGQGGAFIAAPDTGAAVWYNPAGFAAQRGLRLEIEGGVILSPLSYDLGGGQTVDNDGGILPAGLAGASWDFGRDDLAAGFYAYVPSSSTYSYDPDGPQRFQAVGGHYVLAFFHATFAYRWRGLSLGIAVGPTYFHASQDNVVSAAPMGDDPRAEILQIAVHTSVDAPIFLTTNLGVSWKPAPAWDLGASVMPAFDIDASGTMDLTPSPFIASAATIDGNGVRVHLALPTIARAGVRFTPRSLDSKGGLAFELAGVYEGWSRFKSIDLVPDITVTSPALGIDHMQVAPISLYKGYNDVYSARAGGEWRARDWLTLRAGAYYESGGSPESLLDLTAPEAAKIGVTLGASVQVSRAVAIDAAFAHTFFPDVTVTDSQETLRNVNDPDNTVVVGNGTYRMSLTFFHLGVRIQP